VSAGPGDVPAIRAAAGRRDVEVRDLGVTGGTHVAVEGVLDLELAAVERAHAGALLVS
jgi:hypothetical protein